MATRRRGVEGGGGIRPEIRQPAFRNRGLTRLTDVTAGVDAMRADHRRPDSVTPGAVEALTERQRRHHHPTAGG